MEFYQHAHTLLNQQMMEISHESTRFRGDGQINSDTTTSENKFLCLYEFGVNVNNNVYEQCVLI